MDVPVCCFPSTPLLVRSLSSFRYATALPAFQCGSHSLFSRRPFRWFFEILAACGSKTRFGLSDSAPGILSEFSGFRCFCVWVIKF